MADYQILADELAIDPLGRGYSAMSDVEAADDLNTAYRDIWIPLLSAQIFEAVDSSEFQALNNLGKERVDRILGLGAEIQTVPGSKARAEMVAVFGSGSDTITNLIALAKRFQTRSNELNWGRNRCTTADVNYARTL